MLFLLVLGELTLRGVIRETESGLHADGVYSWVQTEMGNAGAVSAGLPEAPVTVADSVGGIIAVVSSANVVDMSSLLE